MANIKVSELNTATSFNDEDYTMIVQNGENKKITKENLNKSISGEYARVIMSNDYTFSEKNTIVKLPLDTFDRKKTNRLTIVNNEIVIGAGVHTVLISGQIYWYQNIENYAGNGYIYNDNYQISTTNAKFFGNYIHMPLPTNIIHVNEGETISLKALIYDYGTTPPTIKNYNNGTFLDILILN